MIPRFASDGAADEVDVVEAVEDSAEEIGAEGVNGSSSAS